MPTSEQWQNAIDWALNQTILDPEGNKIVVTKENHSALVDKVREYFNDNGITYETFSFDDLKPYL